MRQRDLEREPDQSRRCRENRAAAGWHARVREDLSLDYGDIEYTYQINRAGYQILVHRDSIVDHPVGKGYTPVSWAWISIRQITPRPGATSIFATWCSSGSNFTTEETGRCCWYGSASG